MKRLANRVSSELGNDTRLNRTGEGRVGDELIWKPRRGGGAQWCGLPALEGCAQMGTSHHRDAHIGPERPVQLRTIHLNRVKPGLSGA